MRDELPNLALGSRDVIGSRQRAVREGKQPA
jgi:hypothetical protein